MAEGCFRLYIEAFVRPVFDAWSNLAFGRAVGSELVGDETLWRSPLLLHHLIQQTFCGFLIAPMLKNFIQNNAVLINRTPQAELLAYPSSSLFSWLPFNWRCLLSVLYELASTCLVGAGT